MHQRKDVSGSGALNIMLLPNVTRSIFDPNFDIDWLQKEVGWSWQFNPINMDFTRLHHYGALSFLLQYINDKSEYVKIFKFIQPMALGFIAFSAYRMSKMSINNTITRVILIIASFFYLSSFTTPFIFPAILLSGW